MIAAPGRKIITVSELFGREYQFEVPLGVTVSDFKRFFLETVREISLIPQPDPNLQDPNQNVKISINDDDQISSIPSDKFIAKFNQKEIHENTIIFDSSLLHYRSGSSKNVKEQSSIFEDDPYISLMHFFSDPNNIIELITWAGQNAEQAFAIQVQEKIERICQILRFNISDDDIQRIKKIYIKENVSQPIPQ